MKLRFSKSKKNQKNKIVDQGVKSKAVSFGQKLPEIAIVSSWDEANV